MQQALHITNGDAFTSYFKKLGIKGTIITWREMLCEGKTLHSVGSEDFWKERFNFLNKNYKVSKQSFINLTLKEYRKLCMQKRQEEIILWFDADLFCQINMLGLLSWLKTHRKYAQISVISNALSFEDHTSKSSFKEVPETLQKHYNNRVFLTQDDLEFADYAWQLYCSDNPLRMVQLSGFEKFNFSYLKKAFEMHLHRFPSLKNGLNLQEQTLLEFVSKNNYSTQYELVKDLLKHQGHLGFGDSQYLRILGRLKPLFNSLDPLKLKRTAQKVIKGETNYYGKIKEEGLYLGGALKYAYLYRQDQNSLLKL